MRYTLLSLMLFGSVCSAFAQEHDPTRQRCVYYVDKNPGKGAGQLDDAWCKACMKIDEEKRKEEDRKNAAERQAREERVRQAAAERQAAAKAEAARIEQRNQVALANLNDLNRQNEDFDRIRRAEAARKQAINAAYDSRVEKANREYNESLAQLQKAAAVNVPGTDDSFWSETVAPANYKAFQDKKTQLWGFADKKGNVRLPAVYSSAKNFSGGISYVQKRDKVYRSFLINPKGEVIVSFDDVTLKKWSRETGLEINSVYAPDTIANGMVICRFSLRDKGEWETRYGALDKDGNLAIKPVFHKIGAFKNGTAQASLFLDKQETSFKTQDRNYDARFTYLDAGLIDKKGDWVQSPKKKLEYSYGSSAILYLTISDDSWSRLTQAEKDAINARVELEKKQRHAQAMDRLESQVRQTVSSAQGQGYLIEKLK